MKWQYQWRGVIYQLAAHQSIWRGGGENVCQLSMSGYGVAIARLFVWRNGSAAGWRRRRLAGNVYFVGGVMKISAG